MTEEAQKEINLFGQRLRELRKSKKLSIEQLANIADLERVAVSRIELGKNNAKLSTIHALAKALGVNPKEFF